MKTMFLKQWLIAAVVLASVLAVYGAAILNSGLRAEDRKAAESHPPEEGPAPQAEARRDELDKRLLGKQILFFDATVKEGDPTDPTTQTPGATYLNCRDSYTYFVEAIPDEWRSGISRLSAKSPLKYRKVFHGLRVVYDEKGRLYRIENYYAGDLHGQLVAFRDGKRWYEITYRYGNRDGVSRNYTPAGKLLLEEEFREEKRVSSRDFHDNGQPDTWAVSGVIRDKRDEEGRPVPHR
ncbi:MAG TPA: hypothetical protein DDY78_11115 [Planctomycetales bacterium]|nr:hypothetical protein [Planctomycetales bacterium]